MKKLYQSVKYLRHSRKVSKKALRRRLLSKHKILLKRQLSLGRSLLEAERARAMLRYQKISAPAVFSFLENPEGVIYFLNILEKYLLRRLPTFVVLKDVEKVDYGAITVLLSVMYRFKVSRVGFNGDLPKNKNISESIINSGFFEYLKREAKIKAEYIIGKDNQILTHAQKNVSSELGLPVMEAASLTIWGERKVSKGHQRVLVELMQNTNNHAVSDGKGEKHWWLSVNHDKSNKKVGFVFMDHGVGIFSSLNSKTQTSKWYGWQEKLRNVFGSRTDDQLLELLLKGDFHATVTGKSYRGKGLPSIYQVLGRNQISNLYIITNNVYADISKQKYRLMANVFKGTFFYWELCESNDKSNWLKI